MHPILSGCSFYTVQTQEGDDNFLSAEVFFYSRWHGLLHVLDVDKYQTTPSSSLLTLICQIYFSLSNQLDEEKTFFGSTFQVVVCNPSFLPILDVEVTEIVF